MSTMLMVHLAERHLSGTGYVLFTGSKGALYGEKTASPLEQVAKSTVMQQGLNLNTNKLREDLVYENSVINMFVADRLMQPRNMKYFKNTNFKQEWVPDEDIAHLLKYFALGEGRPLTGSYFNFYNAGKSKKYTMPLYYN